jgi:Bacterial regulatory proteins, luxR family
VPVRRQDVGKVRHRQHEIEPFRAGRSQLPTGDHRDPGRCSCGTAGPGSYRAKRQEALRHASRDTGAHVDVRVKQPPGPGRGVHGCPHRVSTAVRNRFGGTHRQPHRDPGTPGAGPCGRRRPPRRPDRPRRGAHPRGDRGLCAGARRRGPTHGRPGRQAAGGRPDQPGIAQELVVTLDTVKRHVSHLFAKLQETNRTQAVARARQLACSPDHPRCGPLPRWWTPGCRKIPLEVPSSGNALPHPGPYRAGR